MKSVSQFIFTTLAFGVGFVQTSFAQETVMQKFATKVRLNAEIQKMGLPVSVEVSGQKDIDARGNGDVNGYIRDVSVSIIPQTETEPLPKQGKFLLTTLCFSPDAAETVLTSSSSGYYGDLRPDENGNLSGKLQDPVFGGQLTSFSSFPGPKVVGQLGPDRLCQQILKISLDSMPLINQTKGTSSNSANGVFTISL